MNGRDVEKIIILLATLLLVFWWWPVDDGSIAGVAPVKAGEVSSHPGEIDKERMKVETPDIHIPVLKPKMIFKKDARRFCAGKRSAVSKIGRKIYEKCMEQQRIGYSDIEELNEKYVGKAFYSDMIYPYCSNKWVRDGVADAFRMAYCLKKEIDGVKKVLHYQKKYNKDKVVEIVEKALIRYGSWHKAAFKVLQYFK